MLPLQQPLGQDAALHTHWPDALHAWPDPHAAHTAPDAPHDVAVSSASPSHTPEVQHPAQSAPPQVHAPPEHDAPAAHVPHAAPPVPHAAPVCEGYVTHVSPLQQPVGHDVASQTHLPAVTSHSCPSEHEPHAPPPVPHEEFDCDSYVSQKPASPPAQHPFGQLF